MIVGILVAVALLALGFLAWREQRLLKVAKDDRPAMLEGGGSHLTVRKGK